MRVLYLHGFASSPRSQKATFFRERLNELGFQVDIPALDGGDFQELTISGQLDIVERLVDHQPAILIGSSLGGYLAALYAARHPEISRLILLAPAFGFAQLWKSEISPEQLAQWKINGSIRVFHYGAGREMPVGYGLLEDAEKFEPSPDVRQPTMVFHGNQDSSVPVQRSIEFAGAHPSVQLVRLESGHQLTDVLDLIWERSRNFLINAGDKV